MERHTILNRIMLMITRIELPITCFENVILVCSCRFWTFGSFRHTCGECYRSLHFGICLQFTEIHERVLTCRWSSVQAQVVTVSVSPQRFKSEFVCVVCHCGCFLLLEHRFYPVNYQPTVAPYSSIPRSCCRIFTPNCNSIEFTHIAHLQAYGNFFFLRSFVS